MAKKKAVLEGPAAPGKATAPALAAPTLEARVAELEGDLVRLADLLGQQFGEPLASAAKEIVGKRQGA